jgi:hypothetical protein
MKKFISIVVVFLVMALAFFSVAATLDYVVQPRKSIPGSEIAYTSGYYTPTHASSASGTNATKKAVICIGVESSTAGVLVVHLVDDYDGAGAKRYYSINLQANVPYGAVFDQIRSSGTTVTLANITLFPY